MFGIAGSFADIEIGNARNGNDIAKACGFAFDTFQALELIEFGNFGIFTAAVIMTEGDILTDTAASSFDSADTDPADIFIIVDIGEKQL